MVAIQQKNSTASGSEIDMVLYMKYSNAGTGSPAVKKWCAHTTTDRMPMAQNEYTCAL